MTKFMWIKVPVDIYNRDRKGGHEVSAVDGCGWHDYCSPKTAKGLRKQSRRKQRRQHAKITAEAIREMEVRAAEDREDILAAMLELESYDDFGGYDDDPWAYYDDYEAGRRLDDIMDEYDWYYGD